MKNLKKIIKTLLSNRFLRDLFSIRWNPYYDITFHGTAESYVEAIKKIDNKKGFKKFKDTLDLIEKNNMDVDKISVTDSEVYSFLPILISAIQNLNKVNSILDVGGGKNPINIYIKECCNISIPCIVLETDDWVEKLNQLAQKNINDIKYVSDLCQIKDTKFDIINMGSSLQYFEGKHYDFLLKILNYDPNYIIITRNFFTKNNNDFFSLQSCSRNHLIPHTFFSFKKLVSFLEDKNYTLIFKTNHLNYYIHEKLKNNEFEYKSLIFERKKI